MSSTLQNSSGYVHVIIRGLNALGNVSEAIFERSGVIFTSACVGGLGGRITGIGYGFGALQGSLLGALHSYGYRPVGNWIYRHIGDTFIYIIN